jgi:hypothetical protein
MAQKQEGIDYRSILSGFLKNRDDIELVLELAKKILALPSVAAQPLRPDVADQVSSGEGALVQFYSGQFYGRSQTAATAEVLKIYGKPQKTKAILEALTKAELKVGGRKPEGTLYRTLLRSKEFTRVAPDTWGLSEWYPDAKLKPIPTPVRLKGKRKRGRPPKQRAMPEETKTDT